MQSEGTRPASRGRARATTERAQPSTAAPRRQNSRRRFTSRQYAALIELAPDATVVADAAGAIVLVNRQVEALFGYATADLLGQPVEMLIPVPVHDAHRQHRAAYAAAPSIRAMGPPISLFGRRQDGSVFPAEISVAPLQAGSELLVIASIRDISGIERVQGTRAQAEHQAEQVSRIFGAMVDGLAVYDAQGRMVQANAAAHRILGMDAVAPDWYDRPVTDRAPLYEVRDRQGQPVPPEAWTVTRILQGEVLTGTEAEPVQVHTPDGRDIALTISGGPLRDASGRISGAVCVLRDETERRGFAAVAQEQTERLAATFAAITDAVLVYDRAGRVVLMNPAAQQMVGIPEFATLAPQERATRIAILDARGEPVPEAEWPLWRLLRGEVLAGVRSPTYVLRLPDGRSIWVSSSGAPLRDADGTVVGAVQVLRDETERMQLEREREEARARELALRELNERLDIFVAIAAHDLRQPVTVSKMAVNMAQRHLAQSASTMHGTAKQALPFIQVEQDLDAIDHNLKRLSGLMQQLLDVSRVQQGTLVLNRQLCDLVALVRMQVEEQRLLTPERTLTLDLPELAAPSGVGLAVHADADRLSQVLANYLANAIRYAPEDQPIGVSLHVVDQAAEAPKGAVARVSVRDHGPGIAPEDQASIWDRFQRARSISEAKGGLGLGLYIARTIIELHGGQVGVDSVVGEGSTFWFTLPLAPAPS
jgi:PAS domain S-box-containing protein